MNIHSKSIDRLFETILNLKTVEECYAYFEDLCTVKEIRDMAQRLDVAILLSEGKSYQQICDQAETSTATVGRVSKCYNYGAGGYVTAIKRLNGEDGNE
ncbi:MAG: hypothetical protein II135_11475 [Clostridia bacterium]|nr:hypothetical protein [Clostridia bacterium]MBQ3869515.1 hypothetical protein [Clostridia bacterium]